MECDEERFYRGPCLISEQLRENGDGEGGNRPWKRNDRVPPREGFNLTKHVEARDKLCTVLSVPVSRSTLTGAGYVQIMRSQFDVQFILNGRCRLLTERRPLNHGFIYIYIPLVFLYR